MRILAIESSCDETAAAVVDFTRGKYRVLANVVYSQIALHAKTGGVVPEVAAREHCVKIVPVVQKAIVDSGIHPETLDAVAVTSGPGLITSLAVGVEAARMFAYLWKKPLIPVNHIEGHVASNLLTNPKVVFPALCLVVSGGHTELLLMKRPGDYECIGRTVDDAVGEAFDKVAKLLHLPYPGGPALSKLAEKGNAHAYNLPKPMLHSKDFNFSFAGIKTSVAYLIHGVPGNVNKKGKRINKADLAASFQQAAVDVLVAKTIRAAQQHNVKTVLLGGGVAANSALRTQLAEAVRTQLSAATYIQPPLQYCGDNASMIAVRGLQLLQQKKAWPWKAVVADPNWELWEK